MNLLPGSIFFSLIVFISCSSWVCEAQECGGKKVAYTITVDQSSKGKLKTVQSAIDSIKKNNDRWVKIHINAGIYKEKVQIPDEKPCIFLEGKGRDVTIITYNDHEQTDTSATFSSFPNNVLVKGITFKNSFNVGSGSASDLQYGRKERGVSVTQAVAGRIYGDKSAFYACAFIGFQDTLWDAKGRHYFKNCNIEGAVDFIFGSGQSYYQDCVVNVTLATPSAKVSLGFITAQGRSSSKEGSGFVFRGGSVIGSGEAILGRAYGPYSRVIFYGTYLASVVAPEGWNAWHYEGQEVNFMYAEVECRGPGANASKRVPWVKKLPTPPLSDFSLSSFINRDGWLDNLP